MMLIVIGTSIWVYFDARKIGVKKGQLKGICDLSPIGWLIVCLFLWIIGFPVYLIKRSELKRINSIDLMKKGEIDKGLKKWLITLIVIVGIIGVELWSYNFSKTITMALVSDDKFITKFYDAYNKQDFQYIYDELANQKFRTTESFEKYDKYMKGVYKKLGKAIKKQRGDFSIQGIPYNATYCVQYVTTREKGESTDSFILMQEGDSWLIEGYNVNSASAFTD